MSRINCQLPLRGERLFRERLLFNPRRAGGPGFFKTSQGFQSAEQRTKIALVLAGLVLERRTRGSSEGKMTCSAIGVAISFVLGVGVTAFAQENPFDAVFAIMTQDRAPDSPGCRGCHIGEQPAFGPYFGNTQDEVENGIITYDNGRLIDGGRDSILASYLREGVMPPRGAQWTDCQLELLYLWLDAIASPYPNIEAVSYSSPMR